MYRSSMHAPRPGTHGPCARHHRSSICTQPTTCVNSVPGTKSWSTLFPGKASRQSFHFVNGLADFYQSDITLTSARPVSLSGTHRPRSAHAHVRVRPESMDECCCGVWPKTVGRRVPCTGERLNSLHGWFSRWIEASENIVEHLMKRKGRKGLARCWPFQVN